MPNISENSMIPSYIKLALRNLQINRLYSAANIAGLAVGLAAGILVILCVLDEISYDKFHKNLRNTCLLMQHQTHGGETFTSESLPAPLAAKLRAEFSEIEYVARTLGGRHLLGNGDKSFEQAGLYADPDLFNIMTLPALAGNPAQALREPGSVVISEGTAQKLFGNEDPIGQTLRHNNLRDLKVAAVIYNIPENSSIQADVILPFKMWEQENPGHREQWDFNFLQTWAALQPGTELAAFNKKIENILSDVIHEQTILFAYPFEKLHLYGAFKNGKPNGGMIYIVLMLSIVGAFVLLIACINFMNLATARSERRAREVGVRKVMGAQRGAIIGQFLSEALVMTFLALGLSILLAKAALPGFNAILKKNLILDFSNWGLLTALASLGLLTGLTAGSYPAFFLSAFQPVRVLKGILSNGNGGALLRKGLVGFQFFISVFLIISTLVIYRQMQHVQNRPLGYAPENLLEIPARGDMGKKYDILKNDLLQIPGITGVSAGDDDLVHFNSSTNGISWPGKTADQDFSIAITHVQYDWIKTTGLKMAEGRDFSRNFGTDTLACLLNEACVKRMGLKEPVGTLINDNTQVIGVIKDFVYNNPTSDPGPMIVFLGSDGLSHFFVRIQNDENWQKSYAQIEKIVKKHNPGIPFEANFTVEAQQKNFEGIRKTSRMISLFGGLAIFIAALGLSGLSAFVAERRKKEMGIRKVMGATTADVWFSLSKDFLKPVIGGFALATPAAFFAMNGLLQNMDYRIELSWTIFALAGVLTIGAALLTVGFQSVRAALANPVTSLRSE